MIRRRLLYLLAFLGSLATAIGRVHDPSPIVRCDLDYWVFSTGRGILSWYSSDLVHWNPGPPVFATPPSWVTSVAPGQKGYFWAPDVIVHHGRYYLYYAVSQWGERTSAIALATNASLDPASPDYQWRDEGIVLRSTNADNFNAIDPSVMPDAHGRLWMAFGSFWSGIKAVEMDSSTGKRKAGAPLHDVAWADQIEAPCLVSHGGSYFLFVNWGLCCQGVRSTYRIMVGRASQPTGPYLDKSGKDLLSGGGTLFLGNEGSRIGPGQAGVLEDGGKDWLSYHYYDAENYGRATLAVRRLYWGADGWPSLSPP